MKGAFVGFLLICFMPSVVLAGVGAAGGAIGNLIINGKSEKNKNLIK